ncbi:MAG: histidine kinase dimerization/phospho-acceptor domain-containing protein, partial [Oscillospiraceae bacterium]
KDGIPEGINIDLLQYVEKLSGLKFNLVPVQDMREGLDLIENDSLDLLLGINSRSIDFRRETVQVTEKILDYDVVCVGRKGGALSTGSNSTIALLTGVNGFNEELRGMFKNCQFIYGKTSADCLDLVAKGKADFSFQNEYILSYLMNNPKYYNLQTSVGYTFDESQCIAISSKQNAMLMRIMDKTIGAIQNDFVYQTAIHHTNNFNNDISFFDLFAPYKYPIVIIILLGIICIALLLVMQYLKRREKQKEQLLVNERLANEAKNDFMSRMSHELRTPMNAIIGLTQLANEEPKNPMNTTNYLNKIDNSSQFLLLLLNDILDMSKMESKKIKLKIESTDFNDVLYGVEDIIVPQAKKKGVKYEL